MIYIRNYTPMTVWENPKIKTTFYDHTAKSPKRMMNASYFSDLPNDFLVISLAKCLFFTITESNGSTLGKDKDVSNNNYHYHISILNTSIITKVIIKYDTVELSVKDLISNGNMTTHVCINYDNLYRQIYDKEL